MDKERLEYLEKKYKAFKNGGFMREEEFIEMNKLKYKLK